MDDLLEELVAHQVVSVMNRFMLLILKFLSAVQACEKIPGLTNIRTECMGIPIPPPA